MGKVNCDMLSCNKLLFNSKLKSEKTCNYCTDEDDIQHFLLKCDKANNFGNIGSNGGQI